MHPQAPPELPLAYHMLGIVLIVRAYACSGGERVYAFLCKHADTIIAASYGFSIGAAVVMVMRNDVHCADAAKLLQTFERVEDRISANNRIFILTIWFSSLALAGVIGVCLGYLVSGNDKLKEGYRKILTKLTEIEARGAREQQ